LILTSPARIIRETGIDHSSLGTAMSCPSQTPIARIAFIALSCAVLCLQAIAQEKREPFNIKFNQLSDKEKAELAKNTGDFFLKRLLDEADRRHVDPQVKEYL
jgi:hypothetical protein